MPGFDKSTVLAALDIPAFFAVELPSLKGQGDERMAICPFHDDKQPSLSVNIKTGFWQCHGCGQKGDLFKFHMQRKGVNFTDALTALADLAHVPIPQAGQGIISEKQVIAWQEALTHHVEAMRYLRNRGYTPTTIKAYKFGWNGQRITMPVYDQGKLYAVKAWLIQQHPTYPRAVWIPKGKHAGIYPHPPVESEVWLCEGEWDCILARQYGLAAYTGMAGASSFHDVWVEGFRGRTVTIVYDLDEAGEKGAALAARKLSEVAKVRIVKLPRPDNNFLPGFDLTNHLRDHGGTKAGMEEMATAAPFVVHVARDSAAKGLDVDSLVPPRGWLRSYLEWGMEVTDAPPIFHLATGLTTLATAIGDRLWIEAWGMRVYPNLWSVLVAPTGFYRKSTCMGLGLDLLRRVDIGLIYPNKFTEEKLLAIIAERPRGVVPIDEFGSFLSALGRDYLSGLKEVLTELYGNKPYLRETMKGSSRIDSHSVSILAGSTIEWLRGRAQAGDLEAGFLPRFLFWRGEEKLPRKGWTNHQFSAMQEELVESLKVFTTVEPLPVLPDDGVREAFDAWNAKHEDEVDGQQLPGCLRGFYTRLATYVLKFAVIYEQAMPQGLSFTMHRESLDYAIRLVEHLKRSLVDLVEEYLVQGRDAQDIDKVTQALKELGGEADKSSLLRRTRMLVMHFDRVMQTLLQSGEVTQAQGQTTSSGGRPPILYISRNGRGSTG